MKHVLDHSKLKRIITAGHTRYSKGWLEKMGFVRDAVTNDYTLNL